MEDVPDLRGTTSGTTSREVMTDGIEDWLKLADKGYCYSKMGRATVRPSFYLEGLNVHIHGRSQSQLLAGGLSIG